MRGCLPFVVLLEGQPREAEVGSDRVPLDEVEHSICQWLEKRLTFRLGVNALRMGLLLKKSQSKGPRVGLHVRDNVSVLFAAEPPVLPIEPQRH